MGSWALWPRSLRAGYWLAQLQTFTSSTPGAGGGRGDGRQMHGWLIIPLRAHGPGGLLPFPIHGRWMHALRLLPVTHPEKKRTGTMDATPVAPKEKESIRVSLNFVQLE